MDTPGVSDAAVIGLPDLHAGELPVAFVVCKPGANVSREYILNFVNSKQKLQITFTLFLTKNHTLLSFLLRITLTILFTSLGFFMIIIYLLIDLSLFLGKVSSNKHLRDVRFVDLIPRNPTGKILRRVLKKSLTSKL